MATLVPLIGVSYTLAVYLIALCTLLALFARNRRALALPLLVCMLDWIVSSASVLPFLLYIISQWEGDDSVYDMTVMFWVGVPYFATVSPVSFSVFSLTLDRIFVLLLGAQYQERFRHALCACNLLVQLLLFSLVLFAESSVKGPAGVRKYCMAVGCITPESGVYISEVKLIVGLVNTAGALAFALIFIRFSRRRVAPSRERAKRSQRQANFLAAIAVLMEFTFNCLPNILGLGYQRLYGALPSGDIGPYLSYFLGTETLCIALMYVRVLGNPIRSRASDGSLIQVRTALPSHSPVPTQANTA